MHEVPDSSALARLTDEELAARAQELGGEARRVVLGELFERHYHRVARWCVRLAPDQDSAHDLAQDVFLRVQEKIHTFRGESRFTTWLYTVTRRLAINRSKSMALRRTASLDEDTAPEPATNRRNSEDLAAAEQIGAAFRDAIQRDLEPLEARIVYLHYVYGIDLATLTRHFELDNKSGAKKYVVSARRKLHRKFGRWLQAQSADRRRA